MVRLFLPCLLLSCCIARSSPAQTFTFLDTSGGALRSGDGRSVNFLDINGDGFDDLFLSNGPKGGENNVLYLNDGKGGLFLTPAGAITDDGAPSDGAAFADADNDGDPDAFVVTWYGEPNHFYRNEGRARFSEAAMQSFAHTGTFSETASWIDLDHDGRLDLFISNSTDFRTNTPSIR